jgi:hypothetical protein
MIDAGASPLSTGGRTPGIAKAMPGLRDPGFFRSRVEGTSLFFYGTRG